MWSEESIASVEHPTIDVPPLELAPLDEEALAAASSALPTTSALGPEADERSASGNRWRLSDLGLGRELSR